MRRGILQPIAGWTVSVVSRSFDQIGMDGVYGNGYVHPTTVWTLGMHPWGAAEGFAPPLGAEE